MDEVRSKGVWSEGAVEVDVEDVGAGEAAVGEEDGLGA